MTEELALHYAVLTVYALLATAATVLIGLALFGKVKFVNDEASIQMIANVKADLAWWGKVFRTLWSHRHETALAVLRWVVIVSKGMYKPVGTVWMLLRIPHNALIKASRPYRVWHGLWWSSYVHGVVAIAVAATLYTLVVAPNSGDSLPVVPINAKTWTTQEDFATFEHDGTQATADGKITLARQAATWAPVEGVPYDRSPYCDVSVAPDGTVAIARGTDDPIVMIGGIWREVSNGGLDTRAVLALAANDIFFGAALGGISHFDGYEVMGEHSLTPMGSDVNDIDGDKDNIVVVGGSGAIAWKRGGQWNNDLYQPTVAETFRAVSFLDKSNIWWTGDLSHVYHWNGTEVVQLDTGTGQVANCIDGGNGGVVVGLSDGSIARCKGEKFAAAEIVGCTSINAVQYDGPNIWAADAACPSENLIHSTGATWTTAGVDAPVTNISGNADEMWAVGPPNIVLRSTPGPYQTTGRATVVFTPEKGVEQIWKAAPLVGKTEPAGSKVEVVYSPNGTDWLTELGDMPRSESLHLQVRIKMADSAVSPSIRLVHVGFK